MITPDQCLSEIRPTTKNPGSSLVLAGISAISGSSHLYHFVIQAFLDSNIELSCAAACFLFRSRCRLMAKGTATAEPSREDAPRLARDQHLGLRGWTSPSVKAQLAPANPTCCRTGHGRQPVSRRVRGGVLLQIQHSAFVKNSIASSYSRTTKVTNAIE